MNPVHRAALRLNAGLKRFTAMVWRRSASWSWGWGRRTGYDYAGSVDVRTNSIVQACVGWICKKLPQSPVRVSRLTPDGPEPIPDHPLLALLNRPNPWYSGALLLWATVQDFLGGNAYWLVVRSAARRPVELWWVPAELMEPRWPEDGRTFISHYDYTPDGTPIRVGVDDVIHFRNGIDPTNPRKGLSQFASLLRELFTDEEAALYTAALLRNGGGPGVILSPASPDVTLTREQSEEAKANYEATFGGDNRGRVMVAGGATKIERLGFSPKDMDLAVLRDVPEERVCAVLGVPPAVVGLGVGLETTKVGATMREMREVAYEDTIIPLQQLIAAELEAQLLPLFGDTRGLVVDFDNSAVRELQEDTNALHERLREDLKAGGITLRQFQLGIGQDPDDNTDVYYLPSTVTPTAPEDLLAPPEPMPLPGGSNLLALPPGKSRAAWAIERLGRKPETFMELATGEPDRLNHPRTKSADDLPDRLQRVRARLEQRAGHDLAAFFAAQGARIAAALEAGTSEDALVGDVEATLLSDTLQPHYRRALTAVHEVTQDSLGVAFDLDDAATREFLLTAGANLPGITQTTRDAIREALAAGQAEGEGVPALAARLRGLPAFNQARAELVAVTEMGFAANHAALASYGASGVVTGVRVLDGDFDAECAAANGRTLTLAEAGTFPRLQHPRCRRAFAPLTEALEAAA